ncbi:hypothetical protein [Streptomyces anulatus]|uniref:hypothetical protein n=1 Tax=Streptomyces anulatus TaxID=1892 RepID=UPI0038637D7C
MSAEAKRRPADVLREARRKDSQVKRARVFARVDEMKAAGQAITCTSVARAAEVSVWLVYQPEIKQYIERARSQQELARDHSAEAGTVVSQGSLAVDLQLARSELKAVLKERDELRDALRRKLGQQLEKSATEDVVVRVNTLEETLRRREKEFGVLQAERNRLQEELSRLQDDLIASQEARRRLLQQVNRPQAPE